MSDLPSLKFTRHNDPKAVTGDMLTTDALRAAHADLIAAVDAHTTFLEQHEAATARAKNEQASYEAAIRQAIAAGEDPSKVREPKPYNPTQAATQAAAYVEAANRAATALRVALVESLPESVDSTLAELEQRSADVETALTQLDLALLAYATTDRRRNFYRTLERYPSELPLGGAKPNTNRFRDLLEAVRKSLDWRVSDLAARERLADDLYRATHDESHIEAATELREQRHELEAAGAR